MKEKSTNIIFGAKSGKFTVTHRPGAQFVRKYFPASKPALVAAYCKKLAHKYIIEATLFSSSMDFPEEEGVTRKQVATLEREFNK